MTSFKLPCLSLYAFEEFDFFSQQIKEGAENLRKVAKDKKSVSDVNHIVKKSITKLSELQAELQELDSQLLVTQGNLPNSPLAGKEE